MMALFVRSGLTQTDPRLVEVIRDDYPHLVVEAEAVRAHPAAGER